MKKTDGSYESLTAVQRAFCEGYDAGYSIQEEERVRGAEALDRIATTPREGENLKGTYEEHCERSHAAAFTTLDSLIMIAREAVHIREEG